MSLHPNCFSEATSASGTNVLGSNLGPIIGSYIIIRLPRGRTDEICYKLTGRDGSDPVNGQKNVGSSPHFLSRANTDGGIKSFGHEQFCA